MISGDNVMHFFKIAIFIGFTSLAMAGCASGPGEPDPDIKKLEVVDEKQ